MNYIFHISDLHIMESNYNNLIHSFNKLISHIKKLGISHSLLVIAGDIFEYKTYLNTSDIYIFNKLIHLLNKEKINTLIIPGNHDYNINSIKKIDNVSLLLDNKTCGTIKVINETCKFVYYNIDFYIFSPIDNKIPILTNTLSANQFRIAILHEGIRGATYDNNEIIKSGRFSIKNLVNFEFDFVLLGDIHRPQFLCDTIAYSGSFVQKNKGEGLNHGYILWNLNKREGRHIFIPLKEIYLRIDLSDNEYSLPELKDYQKIRYVLINKKNSTDKTFSRLQYDLQSQYGIQHINRIINLDLLEKKIINNDDIKTNLDNFNQIQLIKERLKDNDLSIKILEYHNSQLQNRNSNNFTRYKLNYLAWSNILCYGEDNYLDFNKFDKNLVILNGDNKFGKSSIIDILICILFNECVRGYKSYIVNQSKNKGNIKISFNIGTDEYILEKIFSSKNRTSLHKLYKNGEDITKSSINETYNYIKNDLGLGDYKNFVNMTTALQNRKFLIDLPSLELMNLISKIMDIDVLKDIEHDIKLKINRLKRENKKRDKELQEYKDMNLKEEEYTNLENNLLCKEEEYKCLEQNVEVIHNKLITYHKRIDNRIIPDNLELLIEEQKNKLEENDYMFKEFDENHFESLQKEFYELKSFLQSYNKKEISHIMKRKIDLSKIPFSKPELVDKINKLKDITIKPEFSLDIDDIDENELNEIICLGLKDVDSLYSEIKPCHINSIHKLNKKHKLHNVDLLKYKIKDLESQITSKTDLKDLQSGISKDELLYYDEPLLELGYKELYSRINKSCHINSIQVLDENNRLDNVDEIKELINTLQLKINPIESKLINNMTDKEILSYEDPLLLKSLNELYSLKKECKIFHINSISKLIFLSKESFYKEIVDKGLPDFETIKNEIDCLFLEINSFNKNFGSLSFSDCCSDCKHNKEIIDKLFNISQIQLKLSDLQNIYDNRAKTILEYNTAKNNLCIINDYYYNKEQNEIFKFNEHINKIISIKHDIEVINNIENKKELEQYKIKLRLHEEYMLLKEQNEIFESNKHINKILSIKNDIEIYDNIRNKKELEQYKIKLKLHEDYIFLKEQNKIYNHNLHINSLIQQYKEHNIKYNEALNKLKELKNQKQWNELQELESYVLDIEHKRIQESYNKIKKVIKERNELKEEKNLYNCYKELQNNLELLEYKEKKNKLLCRIDKLNNKLSILKSSKNNCYDNLIELRDNFNIFKNNYTNFHKLKKEYDETYSKIEFFELYYSCINFKTGIPRIIIKNTCKRIMNKCNSILQQITDFLVDIKFNENKTGSMIQILTYDNNDHSKRLPAVMGSGFQKFILDMILRITLNELSTISNPNILFIDEGFGCLDKTNFISVANILKQLKHNFDSLFIITHINELKSFGDYCLTIKRKNNCSYLRYGDLSKSDLSLNLVRLNRERIEYVNKHKEQLKLKEKESRQRKKELKLKEKQKKEEEKELKRQMREENRKQKEEEKEINRQLREEKRRIKEQEEENKRQIREEKRRRKEQKELEKKRKREIRRERNKQKKNKREEKQDKLDIVNDYISRYGPLSSILFQYLDDSHCKCLACDRTFVIRKGIEEKHSNAIRFKKKHNDYIYTISQQLNDE